MNGGHYLKKTKADTIPSQAAVIAWLPAKEKAAGHDQIYNVDWLCGHIIRWRMRGLDQLCRFSFPARSAAEALGGIERQSCSGSLTWAFTFDLKAFLHAAGFWEKVLSGEIDLVGDDPGRPSVGRFKGKKNWRGYVILESPPSIVVCRFRQRGGTVRFVDLANYNFSDWRQLYESWLGEDQLSQDDLIDEYGLHGLPELWARSGEYVLLQLWKKLAGENLGSFQATAASQAMYTFKRKFMSHDILAHEHESARKLERAALYGGRAECRFLGKVQQDSRIISWHDDVTYTHKFAVTNGPIYHLDVASMYPFVAYSNWLPARLDQYIDNPTSHNFGGLFRGKAVIADVTVKVDRPLVPYESDECTIYPIGTFRTTLCQPELDLVQRRGKILACHAIATYHAEPLFCDYVRYWWDVKEKAKRDQSGAMEAFAKMMLNSLFGKFSMWSYRWVKVKDRVTEEPFDYWVEPPTAPGRPDQYRAIAWEVERLTKVGEHRQAVPAITAYVNSLARVRLWDMLEAADWPSVFYYHTDSLWCTQQARDRLERAGWLQEGAMGFLREKGRHREVEFRGISHYVADGKLTCAGMPEHIGPELLAGALVETDLPVNWDLIRNRPPSGSKQVTSFCPIGAYKHGKVGLDGRVRPHEIKA